MRLGRWIIWTAYSVPLFHVFFLIPRQFGRENDMCFIHSTHNHRVVNKYRVVCNWNTLEGTSTDQSSTDLTICALPLHCARRPGVFVTTTNSIYRRQMFVNYIELEIYLTALITHNVVCLCFYFFLSSDPGYFVTVKRQQNPVLWLWLFTANLLHWLFDSTHCRCISYSHSWNCNKWRIAILISSQMWCTVEILFFIATMTPKQVFISWEVIKVNGKTFLAGWSVYYLTRWQCWFKNCCWHSKIVQQSIWNSL